MARLNWAAAPSALTAVAVRPCARPDVYRLMAWDMRHLDREHFRALLLNTRHKVIRVATVSVGGLSSAPVHPREVFKDAIRHGAAAIIVVHNHPSGDPEPRRDDVAITEQLRQVGRAAHRKAFLIDVL